MYSFKAVDVNQALQYAIEHLLRCGVEEPSRNGKVLAAPEPVCVEFTQPRNRVLYSPTRDANPWFHVMEALWMLAGENDIAFPCFFNKTYGQYSDDNATMWDAYGWRWRSFMGWDQIAAIIQELKSNPASRRCVLTMWAAQHTPNVLTYPSDSLQWPSNDDFSVATHGGKCVPCNTHCYVNLRGGVLNLTVLNRSNDVIFGMLGANVVHMSVLQEYLAAQVGAQVGVYRQFTNNMHVYLDKFPRATLEVIAEECCEIVEDQWSMPSPGPAIEPGFDDDLALFMGWARSCMRLITPEAAPPAPLCKTAFINTVVIPMMAAWLSRKAGRPTADVLLTIDRIAAPDWQRACREWVMRREGKK